jgi:hypothetical protein
MRTLTEELKTVVGAVPTLTNALTTGVADYVSLKNVKTARIIIIHDSAAAVATVWQPEMATDVSGTNKTAITNAVEIWSNEDISTSDTLVKQTAATSYTQTSDTNDKIIVFEIDPAKLISTTAGSAQTFYDCISIYASTGSGSNRCTVLYELEMNYAESASPSVITD